MGKFFHREEYEHPENSRAADAYYTVCHRQQRVAECPEQTREAFHNAAEEIGGKKQGYKVYNLAYNLISLRVGGVNIQL